MKILASILMVLTLQLNAGVHDISVKNTKGEEIKLAEFKDKALLIVNIATRCGYTRRYAQTRQGGRVFGADPGARAGAPRHSRPAR